MLYSMNVKDHIAEDSESSRRGKRIIIEIQIKDLLKGIGFYYLFKSVVK